MMMWTTSYGWYFYVLAILVAAAFAVLLYRFRSENTVWEKAQWRILVGLRFVSVLLLLLLLLNPLLETTRHHIKKPLIIWAQDNSKSIVQTADSVQYKTQWAKKKDSLLMLLGNDYQYEVLTFDERVARQNHFSFDGKKTDYENLFRYIEENYASQNLGAIVFASDGLVNSGTNVLYSTYDFTAPVLVVPMGDTTVYPNVSVWSVDYNKVALINTPTPVEVKVSGRLLKGKTATVELIDEQNQVQRTSCVFGSDNEVKNVSFRIVGKTKGMHRYRIHIQPIPNERTLTDNTAEITINIVDVRRKILLLGNAPHPDLGALKSMLERNVNIEVHLAFAKSLSSIRLNDYNLVILHNLPSQSYPLSAFINQLNRAQLPIWYIVGTQTDIPRFNALQQSINIKWKHSYDEVFAYGATDDANSLFRLPDDFNRFLEQLPPLKVPFGTYQLLENPMPLFNQKIKGIKTEKPLFLIFNKTQQRKAFLLGEGIWQWRLYDWLNNGSHTNMYQFVNNVVEYLSVKLRKNRLTVLVDERFMENTPIQLKAEFYNEVLQRITTPDVKLHLTNKTTGKHYDYHFVKLADSYRLTISSLPAGVYDYVAKTIYRKKTITQTGVFLVQKNTMETYSTLADWHYLRLLSARFSDTNHLFTNMTAMAQKIKTTTTIKPLFVATTTSKRLIDLWWLGGLAILLLAVEWFLRKYWGQY